MESLNEMHQSTLAGHAVSKNHIIDRDGVTLPAKESDWKKREWKETIVIRKAGMYAIN